MCQRQQTAVYKYAVQDKDEEKISNEMKQTVPAVINNKNKQTVPAVTNREIKETVPAVTSKEILPGIFFLQQRT